MKDIIPALDALRRWEDEKPMREAMQAVVAGDIPVMASWTAGQMAVEQAAQQRAPEREYFAAKLDEARRLAGAENLSAELASAEQANVAAETYRRSKAAHDAWTAQSGGWQAELDRLHPVDIGALTTLYSLCRQYEADLATFGKTEAAFRRSEGTLKEHVRQAAEFRSARQALEVIRTRTKGTLLPALGEVASLLVSRMTAGAFNRVVVDDEFEVVVNDQRLSTLSGSEETAVNLALRIALGHVLTGRVFPVFMGDELDADMDEDRAEATATMLRSLCPSQVGQMIVVSHRRIAGDHHVDL